MSKAASPTDTAADMDETLRAYDTPGTRKHSVCKWCKNVPKKLVNPTLQYKNYSSTSDTGPQDTCAF